MHNIKFTRKLPNWIRCSLRIRSHLALFQICTKLVLPTDYIFIQPELTVTIITTTRASIETRTNEERVRKQNMKQKNQFLINSLPTTCTLTDMLLIFFFVSPGPKKRMYLELNKKKSNIKTIEWTLEQNTKKADSLFFYYIKWCSLSPFFSLFFSSFNVDQLRFRFFFIFPLILSKILHFLISQYIFYDHKILLKTSLLQMDIKALALEKKDDSVFQHPLFYRSFWLGCTQK